MEELNKRAISEVLEILDNSEKEVVQKIPQKFIEFLKKNADKEYKPNINFYIENWDDNIEDDAKGILALIYRDYLATEAEKTEILKEEEEEKKKKEKEIREKYNPDNIFKKNSPEEQSENINNNNQLVEVKEMPWYKRLYKKILSIFGK